MVATSPIPDPQMASVHVEVPAALLPPTVAIDGALHINMSGLSISTQGQRLGGSSINDAAPTTEPIRRVGDCTQCVLAYQHLCEQPIWTHLQSTRCENNDHTTLTGFTHGPSPTKRRSHKSEAAAKSRACAEDSSADESSVAPSPKSKGKGKARAADSDNDQSLTPAREGESSKKVKAPVVSSPPTCVRPSSQPVEPGKLSISSSNVAGSLKPVRPKAGGRGKGCLSPKTGEAISAKKAKTRRRWTNLVAEDVASDAIADYESSDYDSPTPGSDRPWYALTEGVRLGVFKDWTKVKSWGWNVAGTFSRQDTKEEARKVYNRAKRDGRLRIAENVD